MEMLCQKQILSMGCPERGCGAAAVHFWVVPEYRAESANQAQVSTSFVS